MATKLCWILWHKQLHTVRAHVIMHALKQKTIVTRNTIRLLINSKEIKQIKQKAIKYIVAQLLGQHVIQKDKLFHIVKACLARHKIQVLESSLDEIVSGIFAFNYDIRVHKKLTVKRYITDMLDSMFSYVCNDLRFLLCVSDIVHDALYEHNVMAYAVPLRQYDEHNIQLIAKYM